MWGLVVVFEEVLPGLEVVEMVWRGVRDGLWEEGRGGTKVKLAERIGEGVN